EGGHERGAEPVGARRVVARGLRRRQRLGDRRRTRVPRRRAWRRRRRRLAVRPARARGRPALLRPRRRRRPPGVAEAQRRGDRQRDAQVQRRAHGQGVRHAVLPAGQRPRAPPARRRRRAQAGGVARPRGALVAGGDRVGAAREPRRDRRRRARRRRRRWDGAWRAAGGPGRRRRLQPRRRRAPAPAARRAHDPRLRRGRAIQLPRRVRAGALGPPGVRRAREGRQRPADASAGRPRRHVGGLGSGMAVSRTEALALMEEWTQSESLRKHMLAVEAAVLAYARRYGADEETWAVAALLHDFDYERYPIADEAQAGHPFVGVAHLRELGYPEEVLDAILGHADFSGVPRESRLAKVLYACDEITGLITAAVLVRPDKDIANL